MVAESSRSRSAASRTCSKLIDVAGVSLYLGVKLCDAALGSCHPRCELILFNQALGETID